MIKIRRVYEKDESVEEYRILIDRIWPRGVAKAKANLNHWAKEIAPTTELRKWFNHEPAKFPQFKLKYQEELEKNPSLEAFLQLVYKMTKEKDVIFLYAAKDEVYNHAIVLCEFTKDKLKEEFNYAD